MAYGEALAVGGNLAQVAEAYIHLKRIDIPRIQLQRLGDETSVLAAHAAAKLFPLDSIIDVRLEEGSVRSWVSVLSALTIYSAIADYKGFKDSVAEMVRDAKQFGTVINEAIINNKAVSGSIVYRTERRTKTPGKIKRIIQKREWLDEHKDQLSIADINQQNYEIERLLQSVLADVEPSERVRLRKLLGEDAPYVPPMESRRVALPSKRIDQIGLFELESHAEEQVSADYHRRFRLSDGPSNSVRVPPYKASDGLF